MARPLHLSKRKCGFNAQFFGADVASLLPRELSYVLFLGTWIAVIVSTWVIGYAWAWLYNRLSAFVRI